MNHIYRVITLNAFITLFFLNSVIAQNSVSIACGGPVAPVNMNYRYPLNMAVSLSGNYGELRNDHFHCGIDFRVGGVSGAPVFAAERGYVSRISVSPSGYGNALYITHPDGYVSVYGHLYCFNERIEKYVLGKQYENEEFRLDVTLTPDVFPVGKGEMIGKAGNTGSSGGPHLHFEIRDTSNVPLNVFERRFLTIVDKTPPVINGVEFFGYSKDTGVVKNYRIGADRGKDGVIKLPAESYIAVDAVDKQEGTNAKLAVNEYKVYLDTALIYWLKIGEVPFGHGKYINSLIEYALKNSSGKYMIKSYVEPGNMFKEKIRFKNGGLIILEDTLVHKVRVEVSDYLKNKSSKVYSVKRDDAVFAGAVKDTMQENFMAWYLPGFYSAGGLDVYIPPASLYNSIYFTADTAALRITEFSPVWKLHSPDIPLHFPAQVLVKCDIPDSLASKVMLARVGKEGRLYPAGGVYIAAEGGVRARISSFGDYTVAADIIPPGIIPSFADNAVLKGNNISFRIRDDLSGIKSYRVEIDGHWVLGELDGKTDRVTVPLRKARIKRGKKHYLQITVTDNSGNVSHLRRAFTW